MKTDKVTVVLPVYNESLDEMNKSINSILNQTYTNLELIIVNDNPLRKENADFLSSIKDKRVTVLTNEKNMGIVYSLNRGIKEAKSIYVARMDADDISNKERLEKQLAYLKNNSCDLVGSFVAFMDGNENYLCKTIYPIEGKDLEKAFGTTSPMIHPSWLFKKSLFDSLNGYREVKACEDYDFLLRSLLHGYKLANVPDFLINVRLRDNGITSSNMGRQFITCRMLYSYFKKKESPSLDEINAFLNSKKFLEENNRYNKYVDSKAKAKKGNVFALAQLIFNKYTYIITLGGKNGIKDVAN